MTNAIILWTGGKDSFLALEATRRTAARICGLVTFAPPSAEFRAHPLPFLRLQAAALGIKHRTFTIEEPCGPNYEIQLRAAVRDFQADIVVTGDIAEVAGHPNLILELCQRLGVHCERPLWHRNRNDLLDELIRASADVVVSCVRSDLIGQEWVGRQLDPASIAELKRVSHARGFDPCGEGGEYHTLVCDAPCFDRRLLISGFVIRRSGDLAYMGDMQIASEEKVRAC